MPTLDKHQSNEYTKLLVMGDSGSGKTGGLTSLVKAGYKLRILDYDNGLDSLKAFILNECPDKIGNVEYRTLRDKRRATPDGSIIDGVPRAFPDGLRMLDRWKYKTDDGEEIDLGAPGTWGPDTILVIDSLTRFSDAAFDFREPLVPKSRDGKYDMRAVYKDGQDAVENTLATITSEYFRCNVIVIAHIRYVDNEDGTRKGYPKSVGSALSPTIPTYFNTLALTQTVAGGKRTLQTVATATIDMKNPKPFAVAKSYPIETGLADFFAVLRGPKEDKDDNRNRESSPAIQPIQRRLGGQGQATVRRPNRSL